MFLAQIYECVYTFDIYMYILQLIVFSLQPTSSKLSSYFELMLLALLLTLHPNGKLFFLTLSPIDICFDYWRYNK